MALVVLECTFPKLQKIPDSGRKLSRMLQRERAVTSSVGGNALQVTRVT